MSTTNRTTISTAIAAYDELRDHDADLQTGAEIAEHTRQMLTDGRITDAADYRSNVVLRRDRITRKLFVSDEFARSPRYARMIAEYDLILAALDQPAPEPEDGLTFTSFHHFTGSGPLINAIRDSLGMPVPWSLISLDPEPAQVDEWNARLDAAEADYQTACAALDAEVRALGRDLSNHQQMGYDRGHAAAFNAEGDRLEHLYTVAFNAAQDCKAELAAERDAKQDAIQAEAREVATPAASTVDTSADKAERLQAALDALANAHTADAFQSAQAQVIAITSEPIDWDNLPEPPRYWINNAGALLTSPIERKGWAEISLARYQTIKQSMVDAAAYWSGSASAKGPRADITKPAEHAVDPHRLVIKTNWCGTINVYIHGIKLANVACYADYADRWYYDLHKCPQDGFATSQEAIDHLLTDACA